MEKSGGRRGIMKQEGEKRDVLSWNVEIRRGTIEDIDETAY